MTEDAAIRVPKPRLHWLDITRGIACLSMPVFHTVYDLYLLDLTDTKWTNHSFWVVYQVLGLSTFILVSGMAFTVSTARGIRWNRLSIRALRLMALGGLITLATYVALPEKYVKFGILHFFAATIILAPLLRHLRHWLIAAGLIVVCVAVSIPEGGVHPSPWLYIFGLMSDRPSSVDYIPLLPWFGIFMVGMGLGHFIRLPTEYKEAASWSRPFIWLGQHSLFFYIVHQPVLFGMLWLIADLIRM